MTDNQQLDAELAAIQAHLPGWIIDPTYANSQWARGLIDGTGRGIHFNFTRNRGRIYLSGIWPRHNGADYIPDHRPHITIARDRPPEKIAADILRRFLPEYEAAYAPQLEAIQQATRAEEERTRNLQTLAAVMPAGSLHGKRLYANSVTVDVSNGSVNIEIRYTTVKVAKAVLQAVAKAGGFDERA